MRTTFVQVDLPAHGWTPRPAQMNAWRALRKGTNPVILAWHRRMGKDEVALHNAAIKTMERVGNYWHMLPIQEQARKAIWEAVNPRTGRVRWKDAFPDDLLRHVDNQTMKLTLVNGSTWQVLGSDNYNSLVGTTPVGITYSEDALGDPNAHSFFRPILLENNGWSLHISSVRGRNHFYDRVQTYKDDPNAFVEVLSAEDTGIFTPLQLAAERTAYIAERGAAVGNALFEQEYLSNWDAAVVGAIFGQELKDIYETGRALPLAYDPRFPVDTSWDLGVADTNVILFWQTVGNYERLIDWYSSSDVGIDHYAEVLASKRYFYGSHIAPHDIANREWGLNGMTRLDHARTLGIHFERMPNIAKADSIAAASQLLRRMQINVHDTKPDDRFGDCSFILEALKGYRFKYDEKLRIMSKNPVHDWTSHYADALMTRALKAMAVSGGGRAQALQGRGIEQHNSTRLRDILASRQRKAKGAFG